MSEIILFASHSSYFEFHTLIHSFNRASISATDGSLEQRNKSNCVTHGQQANKQVLRMHQFFFVEQMNIVLREDAMFCGRVQQVSIVPVLKTVGQQVWRVCVRVCVRVLMVTYLWTLFRFQIDRQSWIPMYMRSTVWMNILLDKRRKKIFRH